MLGMPIRRASTPDGVEIVLWNHNTDDGYTIMCYPKSRVTSKYGWIQKGDFFCLPLSNFPDGNEMEIWDKLLNGDLKISDCRKYFLEPETHWEYLGGNLE